jgi:cellulose 1,4-beta-cellobiosidase
MVEMDEDGGLSKYATNKAGAKYGTGYCDTQCPHDIKFIAGEVSGKRTALWILPFAISNFETNTFQANSEGWTSSDTDANAGSGPYGACCHEMDVSVPDAWNE